MYLIHKICYSDSDILEVENTDRVLKAIITPTNELMDEYCSDSENNLDRELSATIIQTRYRHKRNRRREIAARMIQTVAIHNINKKMKRMLCILESRNRTK